MAASAQPPPHSPTPAPVVRQAQVKIAPAPLSRREAAKEVFLDLVLNARSIALEMLGDFKASDRFFKYRAAVAGSWVALSLATIFIACPSAKVGPDNALQARAWVQRVEALDRRITAIALENQSDGDWGDMLLKLNNTFTAAVPGLRARGGKTVVTLDKFVGTEGASPPPDLAPQRLEIRCSRGTATLDLSDGTSPR